MPLTVPAAQPPQMRVALNSRKQRFNLDVTYPLDYQSSLINLAGGVEFRREGYGIHAGEPLSWINAGLGVDGASGGIQVFPGFRPDNEVDESRTNIAGYARL